MRPKRNRRFFVRTGGRAVADGDGDTSQKRAYVSAKTRRKQPRRRRVAAVFSPNKSRIEIEIEGFNQPRLLSEFASSGVKTERVSKISPKIMRIIIEEKYAANCFAICRRMCYNYTEVARFGLKYFFSAAVKRIGLVLAAALVAVVGVSVSGKVAAIEVSGTDEARRAEITAYLADNGIKPRQKISLINPKNVRDLVLGFDGVAECSAELRGTRLIVEVRDKDVPVAPTERKASVVSRYDAVVTRVVALGGTAKVKSGDTVGKGQTLIEGTLYRTDGTVLCETVAVGTVYGKVTESKKYVVSEACVEVVRTGKKIRSTGLELFGIGICGKKPQGSFVSVSTSAKLCGFITVTSTVYEEIATETHAFTRDELVAECVEKTLGGYYGSGEVATRTHVSDLGGGTYEITVYTENERIIT